MDANVLQMMRRVMMTRGELCWHQLLLACMIATAMRYNATSAQLLPSARAKVARRCGQN